MSLDQIFTFLMPFSKNYLLTCFIFLLASGFSLDCYAQDFSKKWSIGLNYHSSSEMVKPGSKDYTGINLSVGRNVLKHFTVGLSGTYFLPNEIHYNGFHVNGEYQRKAGNIGLFLIGDIVEFSRFSLYGKTGIDYRIESRKGSETIFNDAGRPRYVTRQINDTDKNTGYTFGIGLEVKYIAIFFIEPSISLFDAPNFNHIRTGIKIPF